MEYFLFPKKTYYLTQGYGNDAYSHKIRKALDVSSREGGSKKIYAPFTGYVAKKFVKEGSSYSIWLVSNEKILCADNQLHYVVCLFVHPKEIENMLVGQTFKQGDYILNDGNTGKATGYHLDFEVAIYDNKEDIKVGWTKDRSLYNSVNPCDYMLLSLDTKIIKEIYQSKTYHFKYVNEINERNLYTKGLYETLAIMKVRSGPGKNYSQKYVKDLTIDGKKNATSKKSNALAFYKKGTRFDALEIIENNEIDIWARGYSGYINIVNGSNINCKKIR